MHWLMDGLTDPLTHAGWTDALAHGRSEGAIYPWTAQLIHSLMDSPTTSLAHRRSDRRTYPWTVRTVGLTDALDT